MRTANIFQCAECSQAIDSRQDVSFVRFKAPGTQDYHYFHWRIRGNDCWEAYLRAQTLCVSERD